jgi:Uma2 family endonuclease
MNAAILPDVSNGIMLTIPSGKGRYEAFRDWTLSPDFPSRPRIDYIEGDIFIELYFDDQPIVIPPGVVGYDEFREWTLSPDFPKIGRIDYINGSVEIDMSPAQVQRHGLPKTAIGAFIYQQVDSSNLGQVFIDQTRVTFNEEITDMPVLSNEPDILFVSWKRLSSGEVVFKPGKSPRDGYDQLEVSGGPDLVVEVLSPNSIRKDTQTLKSAYFTAGVLEYWLVDAMGDKPFWTLFKRGKNGFLIITPDRDGYHRSTVLGVSVKLTCESGPVPNTLIFRVLSK